MKSQHMNRSPYGNPPRKRSEGLVHISKPLGNILIDLLASPELNRLDASEETNQTVSELRRLIAKCEMESEKHQPVTL